MQDLFNYHLPNELIAKYPPASRTDARMLALNKTNKKMQNSSILDITNYLSPGDCLVINNTKVIPAQLNGYKKTQGKVHIQIDKIINNHEAIVFIKANKSPKINDIVYFDKYHNLTIISKNSSRYHVKFNSLINNILQSCGTPPIPPYLKRAAEDIDKTRYQTVFAKYPGAVAAPTAGLHFNEELLSQITNKGVKIANITLHVGAGTFETLKPEQLKTGKLHAETIIVDQEFCDIYNATKAQNKKVIAVGTTAVRTLESVASKQKIITPYTGETELLIQPGYQFNAIDGMLTNFHLPESSLLLLVAAFYGTTETLQAYQHAIKNHYRFFSYGDCMLII